MDERELTIIDNQQEEDEAPSADPIPIVDVIGEALAAAGKR